VQNPFPDLVVLVGTRAGASFQQRFELRRWRIAEIARTG